MGRWIRPSGVIFFLLALALVAVAGYLLSGPLLVAAVESAGTKAVGAKVDLASGRLTLFPLGVVLRGLEVTNPERPMENSVVVSRIALTFELGALVRRKVVVREGAIEGVEFNRPRKSSGALAPPPPQPPGEGLSLPPLSIPTVEEILGKEGLQSVQLAQALQADLEAAQERISRKLAALPDQTRAAEYKKRLQELSAGKGIDPARLAEAKALRDRIKGEVDAIRALRQEVEGDLSSLKARWEEVKGAPAADVRRLREKYSLSPEGIANISRLLFGGQAAEWVSKGSGALALLDRLTLPPAGEKQAKPPRGRGIDIPFPDRPPYPDLWIQRAALSVTIPQGRLAGELSDLSTAPSLVGRPLRISLSGKGLADGSSATAEGTFDRTRPGQPVDSLSLRWAGWKVGETALSRSQGFPVTLRQAAGDLAADLTLRGKALEGKGTVKLSGVSLATGGTSDSTLARAMRDALQGVKTVDIVATAGGTLSSPELAIKSDLDRVLSDAVGRAVREEGARLEERLRKAVDERTAPLLAKAQASLDSLKGLGSQADGVRARLDEALAVKAPSKLPF